ncbi:MAG: deoxyribodipyrimidine photo-lyase [Urechidicola sp.]|jgi:deoxyribodipyrimidine photo-lyase
MDENIIVWHRMDLRIHDNRALYEASLKTSNIIPVFIIDPVFFSKERKFCDERLLFMIECLDDLSNNYQKLGLKLNIFHGNSQEIIKKISNENSAKVFFNKIVSTRFWIDKDKELIKEESFFWFDNDAIIRDINNSRVNWAENCQKYFESSEFNIQGKKFIMKDLKDTVSDLNYIIEKYKLIKKKKVFYEGGESNAVKRLDQFIRNLERYPSSISKPELSSVNCSRLSTHYSFGSLSLKRAFQKIVSTKYGHSYKEFYITRLFWNQHFNQKFQDFDDSVNIAVNPIMRNFNKENFNEDYINAWKNGKTGYPLVDASMRSLNETGWINFRMRAMTASFFSYIIKQYWKTGADYMFINLIDADYGINYQQWQMQSGLVGVHPLRIYNPTKQILDNDKDGVFIRKYVLELSKIKEMNWLSEPWLFKSEIKEKYGIEIEKDYPMPIVKFEEESKKTRETFKELMPAIRRSLNLPEFKKNASLSKKKQSTKKKIKPDKKSADKSLHLFI